MRLMKINNQLHFSLKRKLRDCRHDTWHMICDLCVRDIISLFNRDAICSLKAKEMIKFKVLLSNMYCIISFTDIEVCFVF